ncbi:serine/threonine protein kinase KIN3 [Kluyveromyces lactis]|uniref:non-specific serine/threonine protein kinase n=1 Tax=Kluyveromyces lactis (strain ATCC 8585 / CBS 2359 / DSM 70799 / NBRC 1267 / NRRL Y-1140 / WM37) TaxID=284590 RepID=Q6CUK4_KLULA|nr:uncharacterized protein KLLA0_C04213g [Kluyveromyces lactis]CAH01236.1 KLLA0C04213p [Kluyveromyces lactis]|eukprot:XP_452385.1 uncharacterized protein KLLA0_C04213g [Kluyveromyces lactis]
MNRNERQPTYRLLEEIGRGSFGSVRKVVREADNKVMVRKEVRYGHMNAKERQQLISECAILSQLKHDNIVEFFHWDHDAKSNTLFLYMEYCSKGDLSQMIRYYKHQRKYVPEEYVWRIMVQILMALFKCHYGRDLSKLQTIYDAMEEPLKSKGYVVIHRDLKPGNIFLTGYDDEFNQNASDVDYSKVIIKLGDFGLAKSLQASIEFATTYVGTPYYMSPEVLRDQPYSPLSDIWSLGCILYELCSLHVPFQAKTYTELQGKVKAGYFEPLPHFYSKNLQDIITRCIQVDFTKRPSTWSLLNDIQCRICRKALDLEKFERHLLNYEHELTQVGEMLEQHATEMKRDFASAVDQRVREILNGTSKPAATPLITGTGPVTMPGRTPFRNANVNRNYR